MLQSKSRTWVEIDLQKVIHNTKVVDRLIGKTKIMAVVKANAYGHGDVEIATLLQNELHVDFFAVSSVDEAIILRENGIDQNILILGYTPVEHFHYLHELKITQCLLSLKYAQKLDAYAKKHQQYINGHIKVDTGMSRLGIVCLDDDYHIDEVLKIYQLENVKVTGIFSHFSVSDSLDKEDDIAFTKHQIELFEKVLKDVKAAGYDWGVRHIHNSYGCLNYFALQYEYARPGIILLGNTSNDQDRLIQPIDLQPALEWKANISLVKTVKKGTYVGYGRNFQAPNDMKIASVSVGYADGLNRNASHHHLACLIHGKRCEIIANICMDQCLVDVSAVADVQEGDIATLVGKDQEEVITIDELSRAANTINNESFTLISKRVPRFYKR
ncbi:MAG: alanine racemase [Erysipelotrichia bacterium]|nr:alanine racemase [Erysipelotrichia bacterium]NCC55150.1 alanine racemase [Erysipelotrichia bacterium]